MVNAKTMAKLRQAEIARKVSAQKLQSSGYVESQHGFLTSEDRMVKKGHYAKSPTQKQYDYEREKIRQLKSKLETKCTVKRIDRT